MSLDTWTSNKASSNDFPLSKVSRLASMFWSRSIKSAKLLHMKVNQIILNHHLEPHRFINFPRADASKFLHSEPRAKAAWAALTARSTSALSPSATSASFCPLAGLIVGKVFPLTASTNSLLMKSCVEGHR